LRSLIGDRAAERNLDGDRIPPDPLRWTLPCE
jgi:hypothetical protein